MEIPHFTIDEETAVKAISNDIPKIIKKIKCRRLIYKIITITFFAVNLLCFITALIFTITLE